MCPLLGLSISACGNREPIEIRSKIDPETGLQVAQIDSDPGGVDGVNQTMLMVRQLAPGTEEGTMVPVESPDKAPGGWFVRATAQQDDIGRVVVDNLTGKVLPAAVNVGGALGVATIQKCEGDGCGRGGVLNVVQPIASAASLAQNENTSGVGVGVEAGAASGSHPHLKVGG